MAERKTPAKKATAKKAAPKQKTDPQAWVDSSTWAPTLSERKTRVMAEISTLERSTEASDGARKFMVVGHNQVAKLLRPLLAKHGIDLEVTVALLEEPKGWMQASIWIRSAGVPIEEANKEGQITTWPVAIPQHLHEKGIGAAETYAVKYWAQRTFLMDSDEDLDTDADKDRPPQEPKAKSGGRKQQQKAKPPKPTATPVISTSQKRLLFGSAKNMQGWTSTQVTEVIHAMSWFKDPKKFPDGISTNDITQGPAFDKLLDYFQTNAPEEFYSEDNPIWTRWNEEQEQRQFEAEEAEKKDAEPAGPATDDGSDIPFDPEDETQDTFYEKPEDVDDDNDRSTSGGE